MLASPSRRSTSRSPKRAPRSKSKSQHTFRKFSRLAKVVRQLGPDWTRAWPVLFSVVWRDRRIVASISGMVASPSAFQKDIERPRGRGHAYAPRLDALTMGDRAGRSAGLRVCRRFAVGAADHDQVAVWIAQPHLAVAWRRVDVDVLDGLRFQGPCSLDRGVEIVQLEPDEDAVTVS